MGTLHAQNVSLWVGTTPETAFPRLGEDIAVDVAVVGGGITGLTTAALLKDAGMRVAVLEAGRVASGATGYTTAKLSSLHGLIYDDLASSYDDETARLYGEANEAAITKVEDLAQARGVDCDFERAPAYTYTQDPAMVDSIEKEVAAARRAGLPASLTSTTDLPFDVLAAVRFENQAMFHPRKYCIGLATSIPGDGSHVFEMTRAVDVEHGEPCIVETEHGAVTAEHVVLATLIPFLDRGGFFAKCHPSRSYAIAVRAAGAPTRGMYISAEQPTRSVRPCRVGDETLLIISGEGHKTGQDDDTTGRYQALEDWAREHYDVRSVEYRWSAQDFIPVDDLPYVGQLTRGSEHLYVGTGFKKWGMTNGTAAAMVVSDAVLGRDNPWSAMFDANRVEVTTSAREFVKENLNVAKRFIGDRLGSLTAPSIDELQPGEGAIVRAGGEKVAAYRDDDGVLHAVSPVCTHLGCLVAFNTAERSWDCPCHGSRFTVDGQVISGPAIKDLDTKNLQTDPAPGG